MRSAVQRTAFLASLLGALAAAQAARADKKPYPAGQTRSDAGADDPAKRVASDAGVGPDLAPADSHLAPVDVEPAGIGSAAAHSTAGSDMTEVAAQISPPADAGAAARRNTPLEQVADSIPTRGPTPQKESAAVVTAAAAPPSPKRLPILGLMADVGVPDGLIGSLAIRPWNWVRFCAGGGTNGISSGWRTGITLLPFGTGPSASLEYGRYQDGDANALAKKFIGGGFDGSPVLERVGYQYINAHLGLDLGFRRVVFFLHGGVTMLRGQVHNLDASVPGTTGTGTTEVVVRQDPNAKAVGPSVKLGLVIYIW